MYREKRVTGLTCQQVQNRFMDFMNYRLSGPEAQAVLEHCFECEECMDELELICMVEACLDDTGSDDKAAEAEEELRKRYRHVMERIHYIRLINRNVGFFVGGASFFLILALVIDWFF